MCVYCTGSYKVKTDVSKTASERKDVEEGKQVKSTLKTVRISVRYSEKSKVC